MTRFVSETKEAFDSVEDAIDGIKAMRPESLIAIVRLPGDDGVSVLRVTKDATFTEDALAVAMMTFMELGTSPKPSRAERRRLARNR